MENSAIKWCDHTHNEWIGCQKVSAGCDNCFAEALMDTRYGRVEWGQRKTENRMPSIGTRVRTAEANRRKPFSWQRRAAEFFSEHGRRQRIFCSSLSDVFDNQVIPLWRADLCNTIEATPDLDWLLLTKRPENIMRLIPKKWRGGLPRNVWMGVTCEDQRAYDRRWPVLDRVPAKIKFISYEPALGPLTILGHERKPNWLICGGESGPGYRRMCWPWAEDVAADCSVSGVSFFMKQDSAFKPNDSTIPAHMMIREFPVAA